MKWAGAAASGLLLAAAFPPLDLAPLVWVALVPLLLAIHGQNPGMAFRLGMVTGLSWFGPMLAWVTLFGLPAWLLLTSILALYIGGFAATYRWLSQRLPGRELFLIPLVWTAIEVARSVGPLGFPWGLLGASQQSTLAVLQLAALGGVHLISALAALVNAAILVLLTHPGRRRIAAAIGALLLAAGGVTYGVLRLEARLPRGVTTAVLQPNIPPLSKGDAATGESQLEILRRLTAEASEQGAGIILFPETAVPANLLGPAGLAREVGRWAPDRVVVASSLEVENNSIRNTAAIFADGRLVGTYAKRRLVPFGEAGVTPGSGGEPIASPLGRIGVLICYESAFEGLARREAAGGADLLVVLTNDGWFGQSSGPWQHAAYTPLRAVETGRSVARAANTGISMVVDPHGRMLTRIPLATAGAALGTATLPTETIYLRGGWLFAPAVLLVTGGLLLVAAAPLIGRWRRDPAFVQLVHALVWPGLIAILGRDLRSFWPIAGPWLSSGALLASAWVVAGGPAGLALRPRRAPISALLGMVLVGALGAAMVAAYERYGFRLVLSAPSGGWIGGGAALLLAGLAQEAWLRGAVFGAAQTWRGQTFAIVISAFAAVAFTRGAPVESVIWTLFTGGLFGIIRVLTQDTLGLAVPRASGLLVLMAVGGLRQ